MTTFFGAIADDFTGATDLAGLLARSGVPVSLRIGVPKEPPAATASLEIIALKSRTVPPEEAVDVAIAALAWLRAAGAERFFWKYCSTFDSTPHGNIGPVSEAVMKALGVHQTIYCPAFPENGRSVFMGHLFVGEQPLAESPMKDHPLTPMRDSSLVRLLRPQVSSRVGLANRHAVAEGAGRLRERLSALRADGFRHVVVDAVTNDDLQVIAEACHDMPLLTGGSAVAMALPAIWLSQGHLAPRDGFERPRLDPGPAVVLSGSSSAMTNRQVAAFLAAGRPGFRLDPLVVAAQGTGALLEWLETQDFSSAPIVYATAAPESVRAAQEALGVERAGTAVEEALAACALKARELGVDRFVVAGGETSGAVTQALGIDRLGIGPEIVPGVPWCFAGSGGRNLSIALKSGNFGQEDFFSRALGKLGA